MPVHPCFFLHGGDGNSPEIGSAPQTAGAALGCVSGVGSDLCFHDVSETAFGCGCDLRLSGDRVVYMDRVPDALERLDEGNLDGVFPVTEMERFKLYAGCEKGIIER